MKTAYFGMDALADCLEVLLQGGHEVIKIFTTEGDAYDRTERICSLARERGIPLQKTRVSEQDTDALREAGAELTVTAGYPWKIPVTDAFMQVNLHPALLPEGRGPWPMPTAILRGRPSGVTLHKLSGKLDEGDIILQKEIPLAEGETLLTLGEKIRAEAVRLLENFLREPKKYWAEARPQGAGDYWPEPGDPERTLREGEETCVRSLKLRAFAGYGCLVYENGVPWVTDEEGRKKELYFRELRLSDRQEMERTRRKYAPALSDYTFALLWCWRRQLGLSVCVGEDFFAVKGKGYCFFPVCSSGKAAYFLRELYKNGDAILRFCDERAKEIALREFPLSVCGLSEDDCDYLIENDKLHDLPGGALLRRRNDLHHYMNLDPSPCAEPITRQNVAEAAALSERCRLAGCADGEAEREAFRNFFELGLKGVLVRRGDVVGFAIGSEKDENTLQGHFSKCTEKVRGASLFTVRSCSDAVAERYRYTNLEDDMGEAGLRTFKRSLKAQIIPSYTIELRQ